MLAVLNETIVWWHWIVLGFILLIMEMNTGTFVMLSLGVAAIIVGVLDISMGISFTSEILIWIVLSVATLWAWKRWVKIEDVSTTGQSDHDFDTQGTVTEEIHPQQRGKVTFDTPVLGNTSWHATANEALKVGTRIQIKEVNGQIIEVKQI